MARRKSNRILPLVLVLIAIAIAIYFIQKNEKLKDKINKFF